MQTQQLYDIERKLNKIIKMLEDMNGMKGLGTNLFANVLGNMITGR